MRSVKGMVVLLAFISGLAACSDDDDGGGSSSPLPAASSTATGGGAGGDGGGSGGATTGDGSGGAGGGGNASGGTAGDGSGSTGSGDTTRRWRETAQVDYHGDFGTRAWVRMDDAGNVLVAHQSDDGPGELYVSEYVAGGNSWGSSRRLGYTDSYNLDIERAPGGRAIAAWVEKDQATLYYALYEPGTGWGSPQAIAANQPTNPQVGIRDDGSAEIVFRRVNAAGQRQVVMRTRSATETSFSAERAVLDADTTLVDFAVGGEQRTLLLFETTTAGIGAIRFVNGAWQERSVLSETGGANARVVMDSAGAARVYWQVSSTQNGVQSFQLQHRYVAGGSSGWGAVETVPLFEVSSSYNNFAASAMNIGGEAVAVRSVGNGGYHVYTALYRAGQGWGPLQQVVTQWDGVIRNFSAALTPTGFAAATWSAAPWLDEGLNYAEINLWGSVYR